MKTPIFEELLPGVRRTKLPNGRWLLLLGNPPTSSLVIDNAEAWLADDVVPTPVPTPTPTPVPTPTPIPTTVQRHWAVNLSPVEDSATQVVFADMFKQSRPFISHGPNFAWDDGRAITLRLDGWPASLLPGQVLGSCMAWDTGLGAWPAGRYVVTYDGVGTVAVRPENGNLSTSIVRTIQNMFVINYVPDKGGLDLVILGTDPTNPVRNIKVLPESSIGISKFDQRFIAYCKQFACLRFMDMQQTNDSKQVRWADRTQMDGKQTLSSGVAYEHMIDLCNETKSDAWFCIPHLADNDYVMKCASLMKTRLDPSLKCYVEFTNEPWNDSFQQAQYCQAQGLALGLDTNPHQAKLKFYAKRALEVFSIFASVFVNATIGRGDGTKATLVRVLGGHVVDTYGAENSVLKNTLGKADVYAIAPYFGGGFGAAEVGLSTTAFFQKLTAEVTGMRTVLEQNKTIAANFGLQLVAYEGGQHLRDNTDTDGGKPNTAMTTKFMQMNADMGMRLVYRAFLDMWQQLTFASAGTTGTAGLFCAYNAIGKHSKYGSWSMKKSMDAVGAPKMEAFLEVIAADR